MPAFAQPLRADRCGGGNPHDRLGVRPAGAGERFTADTGHPVRLSFCSSGNQRRQITQGAPLTLFLSADEEYMLALARERYALDEGVRYAERRLALMVPKGSPLRSDDTLKH